MGDFKFSQTSEQRRAGEDPQLSAISDRTLEISIVDFSISKHEGKRIKEEQYRLYLDGKSRANGTNYLRY